MSAGPTAGLEPATGAASLAPPPLLSQLSYAGPAATEYSR